MGFYEIRVREGELNNKDELTQESQERLREASDFLRESKVRRRFPSEVRFWEGEATRKTAQKLAELLDIENIRSSEEMNFGLIWKLTSLLGLKSKVEGRLNNPMNEETAHGVAIVVGSADSVKKRYAKHYQDNEGLSNSEINITLKPGEAYLFEAHGGFVCDRRIYYPSKGYWDGGTSEIVRNPLEV